MKTLQSRNNLTGLVAAIAIWGIAACGGDGEPSASKALPAAPASAPGVTTTAPGTTTGLATPSTETPTPEGDTSKRGGSTTPGEDPATANRKAKPPGKVKSASKKPSTPEKSSAAKRPSGGQSPPPPAAPGQAPSSSQPSASSAPLECLDKAGLKDSTKLRDGLWRAYARDGSDIVVDGPYESAADARDSADSLMGVTRAEPGGTYMVSAPLAADVGSEVAAVADCLRDKTS